MSTDGPGMLKGTGEASRLYWVTHSGVALSSYCHFFHLNHTIFVSFIIIILSLLHCCLELTIDYPWWFDLLTRKKYKNIYKKEFQ